MKEGAVQMNQRKKEVPAAVKVTRLMRTLKMLPGNKQDLSEMLNSELAVLYHNSTSIRHFEKCNQQLSNLICQNCGGSIKILLDVGNQQHAV